VGQFSDTGDEAIVELDVPVVPVVAIAREVERRRNKAIRPEAIVQFKGAK
jgi:hypothetical protein